MFMSPSMSLIIKTDNKFSIQNSGLVTYICLPFLAEECQIP